jgi:predicted short-subunit dehydrogenase-like oxidoreductase (DUF2520 family)
MPQKPRLNLIGAGNVGQTLGALLARSCLCELQDIHNRSPQKAIAAADFIGAGRAVASLHAMRPAEIWLIAVSDSQIATVAAELATIELPPAIAAHCSGLLPAAEMAPLAAKGWHLASAHPVASFADPATSVAQFKGSFCGLEGDALASDALAPLLTAIGARCFPVKSDAKTLYHAAAVFCSNLTTVLQAVASEAWAQAGVPDTVSHDLQIALLTSTLKNLDTMGPQDALTGPAARGDIALVARQQAEVAAWHPQAGEVYRLLSRMAAQLKLTGQTE